MAMQRARDGAPASRRKARQRRRRLSLGMVTRPSEAGNASDHPMSAFASSGHVH